MTTVKRTAVNFLIRGEILALPKFQYDIYNDKEINDLDLPKDIKVTTDDDRLVSYYLDGLHIIFKHPYHHFLEEMYKRWDAGYILGTILIINDED